MTDILSKLMADHTLPNAGDWQTRHNSAVMLPRSGAELAIVSMLNGWLAYAASHQERYEDLIGNDGVLGKPWAEIGASIASLLDGETGRLDCGTLSSLINNTMRANGVEVQE